MLHGHGHHHDHGAHGKRSLIDDILNGQDDSDDNETSDEVEKVDNSNNGGNVEERAISIVYVTMPATFDGPIGGYSTEGVSSTEETSKSKHTSTAASVGVGAPVQQTRTHTTATDTSDDTTQSTTIPTVISASTATATATGDQITAITSAESQSSAAQTTFQTAVSTTAAAASSSLTSVASVAAAAASSASSASATAKASGSSGMSGGAKAGLAIGIIVGIGMIASLVLFWLHKKKQQQKMMLTDDNEKSYGAPDLNEKAMPPLPPPSMVQSTTPSKPPQLNVRPITQFAPDLSAVGSSTGSAAPSGVTTAATAAGAVATGAVAAGAVSRNLTGNASSPPTPPKSGGSPQNPFSDPVNPFGSHAELPPSPPASATTSNVSEAKNPDTPIRDSGVLPEHAAIGADVAGAAIGIAVGEAVESTSKEHNDQPANGHSFETRPASPAPTGPLPPSPASSVNTGVAVSSPGVGGAGGPPSNVHRVQMDFNPTMEDELELRAGQLVRLLHEYDDGWALCIRLDRSQQGVAPRTCLSARPVKPRSRPSGNGPAPHGPPMMGPNGRPMSPAAGPGRSPQTPRFYPQDGRPMSPARPGYVGPPRPPPQGRPMSPAQFPVPRSLSPGPGFRPPPQRSMSPGPYGPPGLQKPSAPISQRRRSNSTSGVIGNNARFNPPPLGSPLAGPVAPRPPMSDQPTNRGPPQGPIERKPVPGQAI